MGEAIVRRVEEIEPVPCPCGESRRLVTRSDGTPASLHVTHILNGSAHYHKETTEFYYVLSGSGAVELDGDNTDVRPGTAVVIPPGVTRAWGTFRRWSSASRPSTLRTSSWSGGRGGRS
jgi:mannose-6-phosphate isomerase-like protein (cupin superfamily)